MCFVKRCKLNLVRGRMKRQGGEKRGRQNREGKGEKQIAAWRQKKS